MPDYNSALQVGSPMSFEDYYSYNYGPLTGNDVNAPSNAYDLGGRIGNWFTGAVDRAKDAYDLYLAQNNRAYDLAKINDARRWDEYMASTQYQRMVKDLKAAGLNPYLALQGGLTSGSVPNASLGSSSNTSASFNRHSEANAGDQTVGRIATTAIMALAMFASKGAAAKAPKAATNIFNFYRKW